MTFNDIKLACYNDHRPAELPVNKLQSQALVRSFLPLQRSNLLLLLSALLSQLRQVLLIHLRRQQTLRRSRGGNPDRKQTFTLKGFFLWRA